MGRKGSGLTWLCWTIAILLVAGAFFGYGLLTVDRKIFPFQLIVKIRNALVSDLTVKFNTNYYKQKKTFFEAHGSNMKFDIVMIGDSITDGAEWHELFPGCTIANRGISGDTTHGILQRMDGIISSRARRAFIMVGINDFAIGRSVDDVFNDYRKIVHILMENGMEVYVQSTILAGKSMAYCNPSVTALNQRLSALAQDKGLVFIDLNAVLAPEGWLDPRFSNDDTHLTGAGYAVWRDTIRRYIY